jgi:threonine dehydrogenase-like Zn-dependent dehydrogenase
VRGLSYDPDTPGTVSLRSDLSIPEPISGEARIRVRLAGICRTDIEILRGYVPFRGILGHEFVGVVDAAPENVDLLGTRVVGEINAVCGACCACRAGRAHHCEARTVLGIAGRDGCLAEYLTLPVANLHRVPECVPDEAAVFVEPIAAACRILEQRPFRGDERVLVMGEGKLGLLVAMVLARHAKELVLSGRHAEKLAIAERAGIHTVVSDAPRSTGFDVVVECTGRPGGLTEALSRVRPMGTVVLKSTVAGDTTAPMSAAVVNEVLVLGSRCGPFPPAIEALERGTVDPTPLISDRFVLADAVAAIERAGEPGALKVLVEVSC